MAESKDQELRGNVTKSFMQLLDAVAQADGMGRVEWLVPVLEAEIRRRIHAASVLCRIAGINPLHSDAESKRTESM